MSTNNRNNPREGLTADSWWKVDNGSSLTVGATPLVKRCMRTHGWTLRFALRVLEGYKMFLTLKQRFQDWDGTHLTPSVPVDRMWREHLVDNGNYTKDCKLLYRKVFIHNPDENLDKEEHEKRVNFTKNMLRVDIGEDYDREVWNFGVMLIESEQTEAVARPRQVLNGRAAAIRRTGRMPDAPPNAVPPDDFITIRIRDQIEEETFFKIRRSTVGMNKVFRTYAMRKGVRTRSLRFTFNGETLTGDETASTLGLNESDVIDVISRDGRFMRRPVYSYAAAARR